MPKRKADQQEPAPDAAEDDELAKREADLARQKEELDERERSLKKREEELERAEEEFSSEAEKAYGATKPDDVLTLNISGTKHQVLRSTLCYVECSLLASMFSGRWDDNLVKDDQGAFFIDQPYEHFKALLDFFRACKSEAELGPQTSIDAVAKDIASSPNFMRMVEYYNCTSAVFPVKLTMVDDDIILDINPTITQYPNMSVDLPLRSLRTDTKPMPRFKFDPVGHARSIKKAKFALTSQATFSCGIACPEKIFSILVSLSHNKIMFPRKVEQPGFNFSDPSSNFEMFDLAEANEALNRPMPKTEELKAGDTITCEVVYLNTGPWLKCVKINDMVVFPWMIFHIISKTANIRILLFIHLPAILYF